MNYCGGSMNVFDNELKSSPKCKGNCEEGKLIAQNGYGKLFIYIQKHIYATGMHATRWYTDVSYKSFKFKAMYTILESKYLFIL